MNTPKIRFKGFTDDWEQRKFSELVQIERGGSPRPIDDFITDAPNGLNWVKIGDAPTQGNYITKTAEKIRPEGLSKTREVHPGDLILSNSMSFGKPYIMGIDGCIHDGWLLIRNTYGVFDLTFLCHLLGTPQMLSQYRSLAAGSTVNNLNKELVGNTYVTIPSITEQRVLGAYLEQLDNLITLHQRKCDETKQLKKFMLQKMFPKNGEKNPEIRFEGFTDDWEQRKLGDVFEQTTNFVDPNKKEIELWSLTVEDGLTPKSERYNREFLVKKDTGFKEVRSGDIVYNPMNMTLGAVGYNGMSKSVAVSGYYTTMITNEGYDSYYINTWLKSPQAMALYKTFATGSLIEKQRVQFPTLSIIPATFPQYEEQVRIGYYFMRLDHLITLHQRKCEKLKELKKYMLQNMFV